MLLDLYFIALLGLIIYVPRYFYFKFTAKDETVIKKAYAEMLGVIKWTAIISAAAFIVFSVIAVLYTVFGSSFYDFFQYYDEDDMEYKSRLNTYRNMFFVALACFAVFFATGGTLEKLLSGKFIDEEEDTKA